MGIRFVRPDAERLELPSGGWVEVKAELNYGDQQRLASIAVKSMRSQTGAAAPTDTVDFGIDMAAYNLEKLLIWLVEWDARGDDGRPVKLTRDALRQLDPASADEILAAIDAHAEAVDQAKKERTTMRTTTPDSSAVLR